MSPPLPERRLRNRSVCCLFTTPAPYPGYYRQSAADTSVAPFISTFRWDVAKSSLNNGVEQKKLMELDTVIGSNGSELKKTVITSGYRSAYIRHRSTPRAAGDYSKNEEGKNISRASLYQARARREFFEQDSQPRTDDSEHTRISDQIKIQKSSPDIAQTENKPVKERRRKNVSKASSGYNSLSSGESDAADREDGHNKSSNGLSPQSSIASPETPQSEKTVTSSDYSSESLISPSHAGCVDSLRSTFTAEIFRVLEQNGLFQQNEQTNGDSAESRPSKMSQRKLSAECNVIELSKKYRKRELNQRKAMEKVQSINDPEQLQRMLEATEDEDQRMAIRSRMQDLNDMQKDKESSAVRAASASGEEQQRPQSQLVTNVDIHQAAKQKTPELGGKENKISPLRERSPSVGGIASLTRPGVIISNGNGSSAVMTTQDAKSTTTKIVARSASEIKSALLRWCQSKTKGYSHVNITNYSKSWCDGMAFCALIHHFYPDAFDFSKLDPKNRRENFELAFRISEQLGDIPALLEVDDLLSMGDNPDYKCIFTYVQQFYRRFHNVP